MKKSSKLRISDAAAADIVAQSDWYQARAGRKVASRWRSAVRAALRRILRNPGSGTPCNFRNLPRPGIRRIAISGFPSHLVFYQKSEAEILVLRVLHGARDLEALF